MHNLNTVKGFIIFYLILPVCFSQEFSKNIHYQTEVGTYLSTSSQTPFWLHSNQYGTVPLKSQFITMRGSAYKEYDTTKNEQGLQKRFSYGYGINTVINVGKTNQILLPEVYLKVRFGVFELYGGRRREIFGLTDTLLSSGSYIWSGNALPVPKLQITIPSYTSILGHGLISIKGGYAHGWFGSQGDVKNYYLHQKWIYGKIGKPNWKIKFYGGFNHQVQWGGYPIKPYIEKQTGKLISDFGNNFKTYLNVVTGVSLNAMGNGLDLKGVPINEALNRAGNHLGTIDIATEISLKNCDLFIYRQSIYDDGSLFYLSNIADGLFGVSLKRKNIQKGLIKICFEYLNTTNQGGRFYYDDIPQLRGSDNYFNNGVYTNGWIYNNNVLGTPLISSLNQIKNTIVSQYNFSDLQYIINNRVSAYHISFSGKTDKIHFITRFVWSHNIGTYYNPISAKQYSFLQQMDYQLPKYVLVSRFTIDSGKLLANNLGGYFGIRRNFF